MHDGRDDEVPLTGGNASGSVVRVGDTVRKPWLPTTDRTTAYMRVLRHRGGHRGGHRGVDLPMPRGRDDQGRWVVDFVPGTAAMERAPLDVATVGAAGRVVRSIHDASVGLAVPEDWKVLLPAPRPDLLCHNDLAPWNLILDGDRLVFIDWDGAGPSTCLWDLAYAAIAFGHLFPGAEVRGAAERLAAFLDGYGADPDLRRALPGTMAERARAMRDLPRRASETGHEPWASMYVDGHGEHWRATAAFIVRHGEDWRRAVS